LSRIERRNRGLQEESADDEKCLRCSNFSHFLDAAKNLTSTSSEAMHSMRHLGAPDV
jgi:hypothetical protein